MFWLDIFTKKKHRRVDIGQGASQALADVRFSTRWICDWLVGRRFRRLYACTYDH